MSYQAESYMLVGFPYEDRSFIEMAVEWCKEDDCSFKEDYENQVNVVNLMPKYQPDLDRLNQQALDFFYEYLDDKGVIRVEEHRGQRYIGFALVSSVSITDSSLEQFCEKLKEKSEDLYNLLGKKGALVAVHDYS